VHLVVVIGTGLHAFLEPHWRRRDSWWTLGIKKKKLT